MYESFFGLHERPFGLTPDPRYFYLSESHREALAALVYGVRTSAGLMTLTGPVGVGKTMILASFIDQIREHAETVSFSGSVSESRIAFLKDVCRALGIPPGQDSLVGVSRAIRDFAARNAAQGKSTVVLLDEAQDLGPEELEHFHHLSNLETPQAKLLQIVLAGTEKLDEKLKEIRLEALWQRVAIRCAIQPMAPEETIAYILHRLRVAGGAASGVFSEDALWRIANFARGVPRLINLVCNQAMIAAYSSGRLPVDEAVVLEALEELDRGRDGLGAEEFVKREEIGGMLRAHYLEPPESTAGPQPGERDAASEREESQGGMEASVTPAASVARRRCKGILSTLFWGHKLAFGLVMVISLSMIGVFMGMGLLKARKDADAFLETDLPQEPGAEGGIAEEQSPRHEIPTEGPGRSGAGRAEDDAGSGGPASGASEPEAGSAGAEMGPGAPTLDGREMEGISEDVKRPAETGGQGSRVVPDPMDSTSAIGPENSAGGKDVARIALEHYGRLDVDLLKVLREQNPQVRDWNNIVSDVQLVLPHVPEPTNGGTDFYAVQVGAFRREEGAQQRASELAARGAQNLLLLKGGKDEQLTLVCVGVYESERQSLRDVERIKEWGYEDAFPVRIKGKGPLDLRRPQAIPCAAGDPREGRQADALGPDPGCGRSH
jgi:type II secretory pathway predicted ATPase ExeA